MLHHRTIEYNRNIFSNYEHDYKHFKTKVSITGNVFTSVNAHIMHIMHIYIYIYYNTYMYIYYNIYIYIQQIS